MMDVGLVGKPNVGKSTFFKALSMADAEIASRPFTTVNPNIGVGYVRSLCPCKRLGVKCNPKNGICIGSNRFTPIRLVDVAGLVPGAHQGKGLGNMFLDDLRRADALIHVIDISGRTDEVGEPCSGHDPEKDMAFLEDEMDMWFGQIVAKNWKKVESRIRYESKNVEYELSNVLAGIGVGRGHIKRAPEDSGLEKETEWSFDDCKRFAVCLRRISKPMVLAANKIDQGQENYERLKKNTVLWVFAQKLSLRFGRPGLRGS